MSGSNLLAYLGSLLTAGGVIGAFLVEELENKANEKEARLKREEEIKKSKTFKYKGFSSILDKEGSKIIKRFGEKVETQHLESIPETSLEKIKRIRGLIQVNDERKVTKGSNPHAFVNKNLLEIEGITKDQEMDLLTTFGDLFKCVFDKGNFKINFRSVDQVIPNLGIKKKYGNLLKNDLLDFCAVLLVISKGEIRATCLFKPKEGSVSEKLKFGLKKGDQDNSNPHIEFTEFGWKLLASLYPFALCQYAAIHKIFRDYIKKLNAAYDNQKAVKTVSGPIQFMDVFDKLFPENGKEYKHFKFFFEMLNSYVKNLPYDSFTFENLLMCGLNAPPITGAVSFGERAGGSRAYPSVFSLCVIQYKSRIELESEYQLKAPRVFKLLPCLSGRKTVPQLNDEVVGLFNKLVEIVNEDASSESSYRI